MYWSSKTKLNISSCITGNSPEYTTSANESPPTDTNMLPSWIVKNILSEVRCMSRSTSRYVDRGPYFVLWFTKWTPKKELKITSNSGVTCFTRANFSLYSTSSEGGSFGTWITTEDSPWMICSTGYLASY